MDIHTFDRAATIRELLTHTPKPPPKQELRAATLNDLRKVERLRALRDDPAVTEGEKAKAQSKLDEIEREIGKVEPEKQETRAKPQQAWGSAFGGSAEKSYGWKMEEFLIDRMASIIARKAEANLESGKPNEPYRVLKAALRQAYKGDAKVLNKAFSRLQEI